MSRAALKMNGKAIDKSLADYAMPIRRCWWIAITAALFASCTIRQPLARESAQLGCKISPEKAQELSNSACENSVTAGVAMCTPPAPAVAGTMVCESAGNGVIMKQISIDPSAIMENGTATQTVSAPIVMPNGEVAAVAMCAINRKRDSVVYALLTRGPTNKAEADYLRTLDACSN
jgi:hypothetical protein